MYCAGKALASRAAPLFARVIASNPDAAGAPPSPLSWWSSSDEAILRQSDVVVLCFAGSGGTRINATTLAYMKPTAYLVVMAHGPGVDEAALYDVLDRSRIAGAAINEWWEGWGWRPPHGYGGFQAPASHPFDRLSNVLMAPNDCEKSDVYLRLRMFL